MIRTFNENGFKWIDILKPTPEDLHEVATQYGVHEALINDVLQPEHLPKYEPIGNTSFSIIRYYSPENEDVDTIQGLTNKIAVFQAENLVITIHSSKLTLLMS